MGGLGFGPAMLLFIKCGGADDCGAARAAEVGGGVAARACRWREFLLSLRVGN